MIGADSTIICLFLGNSLTYTGVPDEEPDKEKRGLTSTRKEKDYVHVLVGLIAENNHVNVKYGIVNISEFERNFTKRSFQLDKLRNIVHQHPDYLIVQIGENVSKEDMKKSSKFEEEYSKILSLFPNSKRIVTTPFWPDKDKEYAITRVAIESRSFLVDLSHLGAGTDENNFASSYKTYAKAGVGDHPGDYGMNNIAQCIYAIINATENIE